MLVTEKRIQYLVRFAATLVESDNGDENKMLIDGEKGFVGDKYIRCS
jgi:hypothetical protein